MDVATILSIVNALTRIVSEIVISLEKKGAFDPEDAEVLVKSVRDMNKKVQDIKWQ